MTQSDFANASAVSEVAANLYAATILDGMPRLNLGRAVSLAASILRVASHLLGDGPDRLGVPPPETALQELYRLSEEVDEAARTDPGADAAMSRCDLAFSLPGGTQAGAGAPSELERARAVAHLATFLYRANVLGGRPRMGFYESVLSAACMFRYSTSADLARVGPPGVATPPGDAEGWVNLQQSAFSYTLRRARAGLEDSPD